MQKFKVGDNVKTKYGTELRILDTNWVQETYLCELTSGNVFYHPEWYEAAELFLIEEETSNCECGAKHTSASKFHLFYCPEYKDMT